MSESQSQSAETKRKLIRATKELIAAEGWSAVSNRAVATSAGVNLALISYHFGSKAGLLVAAVDSAVAVLTERLAELPSEGTLLEIALIATMGVGAMSRDVDARTLAVAMLEATHDPDVAAAVRTNLRNFRSALAELAQRGGEGESAGRAILVAALLDGLLLHVLVDESTDLAAAARAMAQLAAADAKSRA